MLMPKRVKYRKSQRGRRGGKATRCNRVDFGEFGLMALEPVWITAKQIEAARLCLSKALKRTGKLWIRIFPDRPVSKKAADSRMGKGKGTPEFWEDLARKLAELKDEMFKLKLRRATEELPNPVRLRFLRKDIARCTTVLAQKQEKKKEPANG